MGSWMTDPTLITYLIIGLLMIAGLSLLGPLLFTDRTQVTRLVDRMTHGRADKVVHKAATARPEQGWVLSLGAGTVPAREQAEVVRRLGAHGVRPERAASVFFALRLLLALVLAIGLAVAGLALGDVLPRALRLALFGLIGVALGWYLPLYVVSRYAKRRVKLVEQGLPDAIELLVVSVEAGLALEESLERIVVELRRAQPELADELGILVADLKLLPNREEALTKFAERIDRPTVRSVVTTLAQTMQYGTPLAQSLRVMAAELRNDTMVRLEERANRLPVLMTIPMIVFLLPAIFLVVGGPAVLRLMDVVNR